jgi:hypothetical protein
MIQFIESHVYSRPFSGFFLFTFRILVVVLQEKIAAFDSCTFTKKFFVTSMYQILLLCVLCVCVSVADLMLSAMGFDTASSCDSCGHHYL